MDQVYIRRKIMQKINVPLHDLFYVCTAAFYLQGRSAWQEHHAFSNMCTLCNVRRQSWWEVFLKNLGIMNNFSRGSQDRILLTTDNGQHRTCSFTGVVPWTNSPVPMTLWVSTVINTGAFSYIGVIWPLFFGPPFPIAMWLVQSLRQLGTSINGEIMI